MYYRYRNLISKSRAFIPFRNFGNSSKFNPALLPGQTVSYVTDAEGNLSYWNHWVDMSFAVTRDKSSRELKLNDNYHLVYGGDVWDRGKGDLRVINDLVSLKKRYPLRVHFILGNRDINKLRLQSELSAGAVEAALQTYWAGKVCGYAQQQKQHQHSSVADRLRLILERTMGCPHSFEYRRQELRELEVIGPDDSDELQAQKIADSYLDALRPGGVMAEYLRLGTLALVLGDALFVHGAIHPHTLGWVPPTANGADNIESVQQWVHELQAFHDREMDDFYSGSSRSICVAQNSKWAHLYEQEEVLHKPFALSSDIVRGFQRGSTELNCPTANLNLQALKVSAFCYGEGGVLASPTTAADGSFLDSLQTGVYVGCARISVDSSCEGTSRDFYPCVFSVGKNPTYDNSSKTIEAHLLNIDISSTLPNKEPIPCDLYGKTIDIFTLAYLRAEHKFESLDDLKSCIQEDISRTKGYIHLMQHFLNDMKVIKGSIIETSCLKKQSPSSTSASFESASTAKLPYPSQPWSALGGYFAPHPGSGLLQYGMGGLRGKVPNPTVVYNNFLVGGSPQSPHPTVVEYLAKSGITKLISGHQPHGDSPVVMTVSSSGEQVLQVFTCDTSYAQDVFWAFDECFESGHHCLRRVLAASGVYTGSAPVDLPPAPTAALTSWTEPNDTRGRAVAEVCLHFSEAPGSANVSADIGSSVAGHPPLQSYARIHGTLSNAVSYNFRVDDWVGMKFDVVETGTTWWVKGYVDLEVNEAAGEGEAERQRVYWVCKSEDREVFNSFISEKELKTYLPA